MEVICAKVTSGIFQLIC